jgi:DNA-binding XRE family transcriptional regulator
MPRPLIALVTSRESFESSWRGPLGTAGLEIVVHSPDVAAAEVRPAAGVVLDAGSVELADEDELLAWAGTVVARGRACAIAAPNDDERRRLSSTVLLDVCTGLVVAGGEDDARLVAAAMMRRADPTAPRRFEYVTVAPDADELLAITASGKARLVPRPAAEADSGAAVVAIRFDEEARTALIELEDGPPAPDIGGTTADPGATLPIDGVTLGKRMRELRMQAGLTQAELARRTGIHRPNIARVEAGRHTPSLETVARIAQAIGVSPTRVLSGH